MTDAGAGWRRRIATSTDAADAFVEWAQASLFQAPATALLNALRALACEPTSMGAISTLANLRAGAGDFASALSLLRRSVALEPALWTTWHSLATVCRTQAGAPFALIGQRRAHALGADSPLYLLQLGILEARDGLLDAARAHLSATLDQAPELARYVPNEVIMATVRAGRMPAAAVLAEDVVARLPSLQGAPEALHFVRARLAKSSGDVRAHVQRWGISRDPSHHPEDAERRQHMPGYMLIRGWGTGFWAEMFHVANNVAIAEISGRIPFVYWGEEVRYRGLGCGNAWEQFFEPLSAIAPNDLQRASSDVFPKSWSPDTLFGSDAYAHVRPLRGNARGIGALSALNRREALIVADGYVDISDVLPWTPAGHPWASLSKLDVSREIFAKHFRLKSNVDDAVSDLAIRLISGPTIAVHARSPSVGKNAEAIEGLSPTLDAYFPHLDRWLDAESSARLLLFSDSEAAVSAFRERYGQARVVTLDRLRVPEEQDGYVSRQLPPSSDVGLDMRLDGYRLGLEVLVDAYLAARCDRFVGDGASSVSSAIFNLKRWQDEDVALIRRHVYLNRALWRSPA